MIKVAEEQLQNSQEDHIRMRAQHNQELSVRTANLTFKKVAEDIRSLGEIVKEKDQALSDFKDKLQDMQGVLQN